MNYKLLFKTMVGSRAYGTSLPSSDEDFKGVYIQHPDDLLSFRYKPQYDLGKDEVYYEVRRFIELLQSANPTVLELLFMPEECILETSPEFELLVKHRNRFLTRKCLRSFGGYAHQQIQKARGLNKKMNWEKAKVSRKSPLDFCFIYVDGKTSPLGVYLKENNLKESHCGLVALTHFGGGFALYYDYEGNAGYRGIVAEESNEVRLSVVSKTAKALGVIHYNKDGYSMHCKDYKEYQIWIENRNTERYVDIENHQQQIDGKNLMHCRRLLDMAKEIATEKTIRIPRPNAAYLLSIRKGKMDLETIIEEAEKDVRSLEGLYAQSGLPEGCDWDFCNEILLEIRHLNKRFN